MTDTGTGGNVDTSFNQTRQKIIFVGDVSVGKTSIINCILGQKFVEDYEPSIGVDFFSKTMKYKNQNIKLQIWDSAGQEKFKSLIPNYIRGASIIFLVYDCTNKNSFDNLDNWIDFINNIENGNIFIIGNKIDLKEKKIIETEMVKKYCEEKNYNFFEVSAKDGTNIQKMLYSAVISLPFFENLISDRTKEEVINDLEIENNDTLNRDINNINIMESNNDQKRELNVHDQKTQAPNDDNNGDNIQESLKARRRKCC